MTCSQMTLGKRLYTAPGAQVSVAKLAPTPAHKARAGESAPRNARPGLGSCRWRAAWVL